jgi:hypothetical protein
MDANLWKYFLGSSGSECVKKSAEFSGGGGGRGGGRQGVPDLDFTKPLGWHVLLFQAGLPTVYAA